MGDFGSGFSGGDWNGNGHFDAGDYEIWKDTERGSGGGGGHYSGGGGASIGWILIIAGLFLGCMCPLFGVLVPIGIMML